MESSKKMNGLTERQENIARLRTKLNKEDPDAINVFTKYKIITYIFNVVFPPYSLYRILKKDSPFSMNEKIVQAGLCVGYMVILLIILINGGA